MHARVSAASTPRLALLQRRIDLSRARRRLSGARPRGRCGAGVQAPHSDFPRADAGGLVRTAVVSSALRVAQFGFASLSVLARITLMVRATCCGLI